MLEKSYGINVYACICTLLEQVNTSLQPASVNQHTCVTIDFQVNQHFHSWYVDNVSINGLLCSSYWILNYISFTQTFPLEGSITLLFMILFLFWARVSTLIQAKATLPWALLIILDSLGLCPNFVDVGWPYVWVCICKADYRKLICLDSACF